MHRFGIRLFRRNIGAVREGERFVRFGSPGMSDLWGIDRQARHWEVEVKAPGKKPTEAQLAWLKRMHELGCVSLWSDSVNDCERVAEAIMRGGKIVWLNGCDYMVELPP